MPVNGLQRAAGPFAGAGRAGRPPGGLLALARSRVLIIRALRDHFKSSDGRPDGRRPPQSACAAASPPRPGALWQHYKGGLYRIREGSRSTRASGEPVVVYRPLDPAAPGHSWLRPLARFTEPVAALDGRMRARFVPVREPGPAAMERVLRDTGGLPPLAVAALLARYDEPRRF